MIDIWITLMASGGVLYLAGVSWEILDEILAGRRFRADIEEWDRKGADRAQ